MDFCGLLRHGSDSGNRHVHNWASCTCMVFLIYFGVWAISVSGVIGSLILNGIAFFCLRDGSCSCLSNKWQLYLGAVFCNYIL